jgi:hypothetical protein
LGNAWRDRGGGPYLPPAGTAQAAQHGRQRPGCGVRGWHACPHSGVRRRVADKRGPDGSGRALARMGGPGKEMEWAEPI